MKLIFALTALIAAFSSAAHARSSALPVLYRCEMAPSNQCIENYSSFEPAMAPACLAGSSVRDAECSKGAGFVGACRAAVQGANGYFVQTVIFYYAGNMGFTREQVEAHCVAINGEFLP